MSIPPLRSGQVSSGGPCPKCGKLLDGWAETGHGDAPSEGDPTVCVYCAEVLLFDADLRPRLPTQAEYVELMTDRDVQQAVAMARKMKLG
jgi:hypothetical protein